ncbi:unnamed protein product [Peronospora belbahrii]|nr:unnamed protein product [Peronospora belbahrii]
MAHGYGPTIHVDPLSGRYYEDFYKVVVMNFTGPDWSRLLLLLKKEFASYYKVHRWRTPEVFSPARYEICRFPTQKSEVGKTSTTAAEGYENSEELYVKWLTLPAGVPSRAKDGNILEAINVTLNVLDKHYMDRDLSRTGQGIVMMTAGCSIFNVNSKLAKITEQRMMDSGVGMDMISLSTPPLHVVPLFIYCNQPPSKVSSTNSEVPSFLQKRFFGDVLGEEAKPLEGVTSFNDIPIMISIFQPRSPEWVRAGSDVLRRPPTPETFNDTGIMAGLSESKEKMVYDVPHWVNIAFLDFDCSCERGSSNFSRSSPSTTSISNQQKPNGQHEGRVWHSYGCQFKRNKQFNPLPSFRMFDITAPSEKLVFPVMLQNLMRKDSTKLSSCDLNAIPTCVDHNENGSIYDFESGGVCVAAGAPLSIEVNESQNQLLFKTSELPSLASPAHPPEQLQLSRSPDFDPILASKGFPTNLNASWRRICRWQKSLR